MREIFSSIRAQMQAGHDVILATLVESAGSTPRGMGTQMVITQHGRAAGTIGGGGGENAMIEIGLSLLREKRSALHTYALHGKAGQKMGSVCGGDMTAYLSYIAADDPAWTVLVQMLLERIAMRQEGWLLLPLDGSRPALMNAERQTLLGGCVEDAQALCRPCAVRTQAVFSMPLHIGERAVLFGAGHCAQALAPILASVGFCVTVYDDRASLADPALFPQAERVICAPYDCIAQHIALGEEDYVVAMTATHASDLCVQKQVLTEEHAYTGMLGSRTKREFVHGRLLEAGIDPARIAAVHTPIGLPIKAVTPAEIALSIAGEMVLVRAHRREQLAAAERTTK